MKTNEIRSPSLSYRLRYAGATLKGDIGQLMMDAADALDRAGDRHIGTDEIIVPLEPTKAMIDAAYSRMRMDPSCAPFSRRILLKGWDAMLMAASVRGAGKVEGE